MIIAPRYSATLFDTEQSRERPRVTAADFGRLVERTHPFDLPPEPYPLVIGTSGGRTSGRQLYAYLSRLGHSVLNGPRVLVAFCNTGEETEAALQFVKNQQVRWGVNVVWLEFRFERFPLSLTHSRRFWSLRRRQYQCLPRQCKNRGVPYDRERDLRLRREVASLIEVAGFPDQADDIRQGRETTNGRDSFGVVTFETASRNREPFDDLLRSREDYRRKVKGLPGVLPNSSNNGMCTGKLKVDVIANYMRERFGVSRNGYAVALALRAGDRDEERQGAISGRASDGGIPIFPLIEADINAEEIAAFWRTQPFKLNQPGWEGNCRECHLKPKSVLQYLLHSDRERAAWRIGWEDRTGDRFDRGNGSYRRLLQQLPLIGDPPDDTGSAVRCHGGYCGD